jgi:protein TonB
MAPYSGSSYVVPATNYRRLIGFIIVVVLHVALFYALQSGLAKTLIDKFQGPLETRLIEEIQPDEEEPPPPPPKFQAPPPVFVDMPDVAITETSNTTAIQNVTNVKPKAAPPPPPAQKIIVPPRSNPRRPNVGPEEIYPAMSKRLGEEGSVVLLLTVDISGKVTEAKVATSSGFERLDEAAAKEAVRSWRFLPGTIDGKPAAMQTQIKVTFKIK